MQTCNKMDIKQLKRELNLTSKDLAFIFGLSYSSFKSTTARKRYERALCRFYEIVKLHQTN